MAKNPLSNWYGFEKKVTKPEQSYEDRDLAIYKTSYYNHAVHMSPEIARLIRSAPNEDARRSIKRLYFPPADGFTDEDFIKFLETPLTGDAAKGHYNWRTIEALNQSAADLASAANNYSIKAAFSKFFDASSPRTDRLLRIIEINEFLNHTKPDDLTFENFLETDTSVEEKCKKLILHEHSIPLETFFNYSLPEFLQYPARIALKTKQLLLPLTKEQMLKVFDVESNPYARANSSNSHSFEFAELYIAAALGEVTEAPVKELTDKEVSNAITLSLLSKTEYWDKVSSSRRCARLLSNILEEFEKIAFTADTFKRNFAYLVEADVLKELTATELAAVVFGFEKSHRWAEPNKGKSTLEVLMELMQSKKLDPVAGAKLIAHIINNHLQPIVLELDYDWSILVDAPPAWAYEMLPHSEKKRSIGQPPLVVTMNKF
jgi:hypothetical protein